MELMAKLRSGVLSNVAVRAVFWDTENHRFPLSFSRSHPDPQTGRPTMSRSRQSRLLP